MSWHRCERWQTRLGTCPFRILEEPEEDEGQEEPAQVVKRARPRAREAAEAVMVEVAAGIEEAENVADAVAEATREPAPKKADAIAEPARVPITPDPNAPVGVPSAPSPVAVPNPVALHVTEFVAEPVRMVEMLVDPEFWRGENRRIPTPPANVLATVEKGFESVGLPPPYDPVGIANAPLELRQEKSAWAALTERPTATSIDFETLREGSSYDAVQRTGAGLMLQISIVAAAVVALGMHRGMTMAQLEARSATLLKGANLSRIMPSITQRGTPPPLATVPVPPKSGVVVKTPPRPRTAPRGYLTGGGWGEIWSGGGELP